MTKPIIHIKWDTWDWIIEIIGAVFLLLMIGFPIYFFAELPDVIPRHFNAAGEPDGYSGKDTIWTLPVIGVLMYVGMFTLNRYPHIFNYPTEITPENAERQYRVATKLVRVLNVLIVASFWYIGLATIQVAMSNQVGLGPLFMPIFLSAIFGTIGVYLYQAIKSPPPRGK